MGNLPYSRSVRGIRLQKLHFEHTSKEKTRNPKSTILVYDLSQLNREMNKSMGSHWKDTELDKMFTSRNDVPSKSHYNQHGKRSKSVGNYHISTQGSHKTEESCGHLVQKEIYQELPKKSAVSST